MRRNEAAQRLTTNERWHGGLALQDLISKLCSILYLQPHTAALSDTLSGD